MALASIDVEQARAQRLAGQADVDAQHLRAVPQAVEMLVEKGDAAAVEPRPSQTPSPRTKPESNTETLASGRRTSSPLTLIKHVVVAGVADVVLRARGGRGFVRRPISFLSGEAARLAERAATGPTRAAARARGASSRSVFGLTTLFSGNAFDVNESRIRPLMDSSLLQASTILVKLRSCAHLNARRWTLVRRANTRTDPPTNVRLCVYPHSQRRQFPMK